MNEPFKEPTCKGSYALGTACGHCERCEREACERMETTGAPVSFFKSSNDGDASELIRTVVSEISRMAYEGDVRAIAVVIVDKDGDLRTMFANQPKTKLPMIAGVAVLQREAMDLAMQPITKDRSGT